MDFLSLVGVVSEVASSAASLVAPWPPVGIAVVLFGAAGQPPGGRHAVPGHAPICSSVYCSVLYCAVQCTVLHNLQYRTGYCFVLSTVM